MPDDPIIASNQTFGDVYADIEKKELYCLVECPPIGKLRVRIHSDSFTFDVEHSQKPDGTPLLCLRDVFGRNKASQAAAMLHQLSPHWQVVWPRIYEALLQVRNDYGRTPGITHQNCVLSLTPPDGETEHWGCELGLDPWDGFYAVKFNTAGEITDACAMF